MLGCFLEIDEFKFEVGNAVKVSIDSHQGKIMLYCGCGNKGINIANVLMHWPQGTPNIGISVENRIRERVGGYLSKYLMEGGIMVRKIGQALEVFNYFTIDKNAGDNGVVL